MTTPSRLQNSTTVKTGLGEDLHDNLVVQGGRVLWHSRDRDEVYRKAIELRPKRFAVLYTGKPEKDTAIIL